MKLRWHERALHVQFAVSLVQLLELGYWLAAIVLGLWQASAYWDRPSSVDAVAYLDIGDAYLHGQWREALNGYWNPLYSWILGLVVAVVRPALRYEYATAKLVDCGIYVLALAAFHWLLKELRVAYRLSLGRDPEPRIAIPDWAWIVGGYTLFLWSSIHWIRLSSNSPDMLAAAITYGVWGLVLRNDEQPRLLSFVTLGALLALGYFARTPLLPVGGVLLLLLAFVRTTAERRRGAAAAAVTLALLTAPFIASLSMARNHLTIGDSGKLNHAWLANPGNYTIPGVNWQGGPPGYGVPRHPTRLVWDDPPMFEFSEPIGGTYPPWTDPSYWYEGLAYHFDAAAEWTTLRDNLQFSYDMFGQWLLIALVVVVAAFGAVRPSLRTAAANAPLWAPPLAGIAMYMVALDLVVRELPPQPHSRYLATFVTLIVLAAAFSFRARGHRLTRIGTAGLAVGLGVLTLATVTALAGEVSRETREPAPQAPWVAADALRRSGIDAGMPIAIVGHEVRHELWARLARARIVVQVPSDEDFWRKSPMVQDAMLRIFARSGARAVVSWRSRRDWVPEGWMDVAGTDYIVRDLSAFR